MTMVVPVNSRLKSGRDFQEVLRKDPTALSIGIGVARGGTNHLSVALLMKAMGLDVKQMKTVVFQGNSDSLTALMGGHIDLGSMSFAQAKNGALQGQLRILGVAAEKRLEGEFSNIPTWREQGYDVVLLNQRYVLAPKGLTTSQIAYWETAFQKLAQTDEWKAEVKKRDWVEDHAGSRETVQLLGVLYPKLKGALIEAGLAKP
jgi:putative tricarboxylic transport membrane protein